MLGDALTGLGVRRRAEERRLATGKRIRSADLTEVLSVRVVVPTLRDQQAVSLSSSAEDHSGTSGKLVKMSISRVTIGDFVRS